MTTFAPHRDTVEAFVDHMHGGADKDALSGILAEDVVLYSPLGNEPTTINRHSNRCGEGAVVDF